MTSVERPFRGEMIPRQQNAYTPGRIGAKSYEPRSARHHHPETCVVLPADHYVDAIEPEGGPSPTAVCFSGNRFCTAEGRVGLEVGHGLRNLADLNTGPVIAGEDPGVAQVERVVATFLWRKLRNRLNSATVTPVGADQRRECAPRRRQVNPGPRRRRRPRSLQFWRGSAGWAGSYTQNAPVTPTYRCPPRPTGSARDEARARGSPLDAKCAPRCRRGTAPPRRGNEGLRRRGWPRPLKTHVPLGCPQGRCSRSASFGERLVETPDAIALRVHRIHPLQGVVVLCQRSQGADGQAQAWESPRSPRPR